MLQSGPAREERTGTLRDTQTEGRMKNEREEPRDGERGKERGGRGDLERRDKDRKGWTTNREKVKVTYSSVGFCLCHLLCILSEDSHQLFRKNTELSPLCLD